MDIRVKRELEGIREELKKIAAELETVSGGVRRDFTGIGNERCATGIANTADRLRVAERKLAQMDTTLLTPEFAAAQEETTEA